MFLSILGNFMGSQTDTVDSVDKLNDGEKLLNAPVSGELRTFYRIMMITAAHLYSSGIFI